jgi:branched-chain amino acid transport system ATP-binding protein
MAFLKESATPLLQVEGLHMNFGGIRALSDFSFKVDEGEIRSVIGPNGAGKTTLINCMSGIYRAKKGTILFKGREITGRNPNQIAHLGMARTFQNIALFRGMTVLDNMLIGQGYLLHYGLLSVALFLGRALNEEVRGRDKVEEIIEFLDLQHVRKSPVGGLPYGMNLEETEDMARYVLDINEELGITIILIEHDMGLVMDISHRITVLNFGLKIAEGAPNEIVKNPEVIKAYLGEVGD